MLTGFVLASTAVGGLAVTTTPLVFEALLAARYPLCNPALTVQNCVARPWPSSASSGKTSQHTRVGV